MTNESDTAASSNAIQPPTEDKVSTCQQAAAEIPAAPGTISLPVETGRIQMQVDLPPGTCLQIEIEARTTSGQPLGRHVITLGGPLEESQTGFDSAPRDDEPLRTAQLELEPVSVSSPPAGQPIPAENEDISILEAIKGRLRASAMPARRARPSGVPLTRAAFNVRALSLPAWLFWAALGIYTITRLVALPSFPIYFFTDEAIQTVKAADLLRDHLLGQGNEFLPTYFENGSQLNLSASVYLQMLPYYFFGKSIWVTRGTAALATLIAAVCVGLILKRVFKSPYPWLATLILAVTPAWFIHSRTAFETALASSFFAAFLYYYLMYRTANPRYLYGAVVAGALMFYSYTPARVIIGVTALLLLISDGKYHWKNRPVLLRGSLLVLVLAIPFIRFLFNHPQASGWQLQILGSYWIQDIPLAQKISQYVAEYLSGLDPFYWYLPTQRDLARHVMLNYGHLLRQTLPFGLLGVAIAIYRAVAKRSGNKQPVIEPAEAANAEAAGKEENTSKDTAEATASSYRALLIAILAVPSGAALVNIGITRVLAMVIPMAILTAIGISAIMEWLHNRKGVSQAWMGWVVFLVLSATSLYMLRDALVNGPLWFRDYGLGGMQYGARQLFGEINSYLIEHPEAHLIVSPSWANGTDVTARFFFPDALPFEMGNADGYYNEGKPIDSNTIFVMIPEELKQLPQSRFSEVKIEKTIPYPDGKPGFYFVRLTYVENIDQVLSREKAARHELETATAQIDGQTVQIRHTQLDMGQFRDVLDDRPNTLIRTNQVNPMQMIFEFPAPRPLSGIALRIGGSATDVRIQTWAEGQSDPQVLDRKFAEVANPRDVKIQFDTQRVVNRVTVEISNINDPPEGHVHLWEIQFIQ